MPPSPTETPRIAVSSCALQLPAADWVGIRVHCSESPKMRELLWDHRGDLLWDTRPRNWDWRDVSEATNVGFTVAFLRTHLSHSQTRLRGTSGAAAWLSE